jgi:poly(A) polymerase
MHAEEVLTVSWERIRDEFTKIIALPDVEKAMGLMRTTGLLSVILPEFDPMWNCKQSPKWHPEGTAGVHTVLVMKHTPAGNVIVRWAALLHDIGKPATSKEKNDGTGGVSAHGHEFVGADMAGPILNRFKFSSADTNEIVELVRHHMEMHRLSEMKPHTTRRLLAEPFFENLVLLSKGDNLGSAAGQQGIDDMMRDIADLKSRFPEMCPVPFITGDTLITMGFAPSKAFRITLDRAFKQQLDGESKDKISKRLKGWMNA